MACARKKFICLWLPDLGILITLSPGTAWPCLFGFPKVYQGVPCPPHYFLARFLVYPFTMTATLFLVFSRSTTQSQSPVRSIAMNLTLFCDQKWQFLRKSPQIHFEFRVIYVWALSWFSFCIYCKGHILNILGIPVYFMIRFKNNVI